MVTLKAAAILDVVLSLVQINTASSTWYETMHQIMQLLTWQQRLAMSSRNDTIPHWN